MVGVFTPLELINATNQDLVYWVFLIVYSLESDGEDVNNAD